MTEQSPITGTALALPATEDLAKMLSQPGGIDPVLDRLEKAARAEAPDLTTEKGRKAVKSLAYKVSQSKTALDAVAVTLTEDAQKLVKAVNAERAKFKTRLDALRDEVKAPVEAWEAAEAERVDRHKTNLAALDVHAAPSDTAEQISAKIASVEAMEIGPAWEEYAGAAAETKSARLAQLRADLAAAETREAQAAELEQLRREKAEREEADRLAREAAEAEARRTEAERVESERRAEAEKAEAERAARIEAEKREAARVAAEQAEARAKAEAAEREAAMERARVEAEERHKRELAEAKAREEAAAQRERDRIAAEQKNEADAKAKREADARHVEKVRWEIAGGIIRECQDGIAPATAQAIAEALIAGRIPHVQAVI